MTKLSGILGIVCVALWVGVSGWKFVRSGGVKRLPGTVRSLGKSVRGFGAKAATVIKKGRKLAGTALSGQ